MYEPDVKNICDNCYFKYTGKTIAQVYVENNNYDNRTRHVNMFVKFMENYNKINCS